MARATTAARRYAEAAFELATRDGALDAWADGLRLAAGIAAQEEAARVIDNPAIPLAERQAALDALLGGRVPDGVRNLARLLATRGRFETMTQVAGHYDRLLNRQRGVVEAVVTSAEPLTPDETEAVRRKVEHMTGTRVQLRSEVDTALIGGLTVRVGDQLLDASVRGRLERLRHELIQGTR